MVTFLADRANLQHKRLHDRIQHRLSREFADAHRRRTDPHEAGPYRVVADVDPRQFLDDDTYPVTTARLEIGFQLETGTPYEYHWCNWIEPDRPLLVGWYQDDTLDDLGPTRLRVTDGETTVAHEPAQVVDAHPLAVVERRLDSFRDVIPAVEWEQGRPVGLDPEVPPGP